MSTTGLWSGNTMDILKMIQSQYLNPPGVEVTLRKRLAYRRAPKLSLKVLLRCNCAQLLEQVARNVALSQMRLAVAYDRDRQEDSTSFGAYTRGGERRVSPTGDVLGVGLVPLLMEV